MKYLRVVLSMIFIIGLIMSVALCSSAQISGNNNKGLAVDSLVSAGGEASYRILVKNDDTKLHKYTLSQVLLPKGFKADFIVDSRVMNEFQLKAGSSIIVDSHVTVAKDAAADTNIFRVEIKRDDLQTYSVPLSITVNRDYSLAITNRIKNLSVINGQSLSLDIAVSNTGSKDLNNIMLKFELPYKWVIQSLNPEKLSLKAGEEGVYKVQVSVPSSQVSGNSKLKVLAAANDVISPQTVISVTVQNNPSYIYWVIGLIAVAGVGTILYFRKHGRR